MRGGDPEPVLRQRDDRSTALILGEAIQTSGVSAAWRAAAPQTTSGSSSLTQVDIDEVSRVATALDGVRESSVKGRLRWSLGGRLVARQLDDRSIVIRTGFAEREQLLVTHPATFFVPPRFDAHMMVVANLPSADPTVVASAICAAWELQRSAA
jgi:hypothetical protein